MSIYTFENNEFIAFEPNNHATLHSVMLPHFTTPLSRTILLSLLGTCVLGVILALIVGNAMRPFNRKEGLASHVPAESVRLLLRAPSTPALTSLMQSAQALGFSLPPPNAAEEMNATEYAVLDTGSGAVGWALYGKDMIDASSRFRLRIVSSDRKTADMLATVAKEKERTLADSEAFQDLKSDHPFSVYLRTDAIVWSGHPADSIVQALLSGYSSIHAQFSADEGSILLRKNVSANVNTFLPPRIITASTQPSVSIALARPREAILSAQAALRGVSLEQEEGLTGIVMQWMLDAGLSPETLQAVADAPASLSIWHGSGASHWILSLTGREDTAEALITSLSRGQVKGIVRHFDFFGEQSRTDLIADDRNGIEREQHGSWTMVSIERRSPLPSLTVAFRKNELRISDDETLMTLALNTVPITPRYATYSPPSIITEWQSEEAQQALHDALPFLTGSGTSFVLPILSQATGRVHGEVFQQSDEDILVWKQEQKE